MCTVQHWIHPTHRATNASRMWLAEKCPRPLLMSRGAALLAVLMVSRSLADFTVLSLSGPASPVSAPHCLAQLHQFQQYFQCTWYCTGVEEYTWEVKPPHKPPQNRKMWVQEAKCLGAHCSVLCWGKGGAPCPPAPAPALALGGG